MLFRRMKDPVVLLRLGLIFLIAATLATRFVHPTAQFPEDFTDGLKGLLYGLAIGLMLLSIRLRARRSSSH